MTDPKKTQPQTEGLLELGEEQLDQITGGRHQGGPDGRHHGGHGSHGGHGGHGSHGGHGGHGGHRGHTAPQSMG